MNLVVLDIDVASLRLRSRIAVIRELPLATLNVKDVEDFRDHEGLALVG